MCEVILQSGNVRLQHPSVSPPFVKHVWWCILIPVNTYLQPADALQLSLRQIANNHRGGSGPAEQHFIMRGVLGFEALWVHMSRDTTGDSHPLNSEMSLWSTEDFWLKQQLLTSYVEYTLSIHSWGALSSGSQLNTTPTIWPFVSMTTSPTRKNTYGGRGLRAVLEAGGRRIGTGQRWGGCSLCRRDKTETSGLKSQTSKETLVIVKDHGLEGKRLWSHFFIL